MATEIERKFLVKTEYLPDLNIYPRAYIVQGYLSLTPVVRIRVEQKLKSPDYSEWVETAYQTTKGPGLVSRKEFEYEIPVADAREMLMLSKTLLIHKTRHLIPYKYSNFEVDCFDWPHRGWLAEVELSSEADPVSFPEWLGEEVTKDGRYSNTSLAVSGFPMRPPAPKGRRLVYEPGMTINGIGQRTGEKSTAILMKLLTLGMKDIHINKVLDASTVQTICKEFGWTFQDTP